MCDSGARFPCVSKKLEGERGIAQVRVKLCMCDSGAGSSVSPRSWRMGGGLPRVRVKLCMCDRGASFYCVCMTPQIGESPLNVGSNGKTTLVPLIPFTMTTLLRKELPFSSLTSLLSLFHSTPFSTMISVEL
jgi:hypothetical protein